MKIIIIRFILQILSYRSLSDNLCEEDFFENMK